MLKGRELQSILFSFQLLLYTGCLHASEMNNKFLGCSKCLLTYIQETHIFVVQQKMRPLIETNLSLWANLHAISYQCDQMAWNGIMIDQRQFIYFCIMALTGK